MGYTLTEKIIYSHLDSKCQKIEKGEEILIHIDNTLTQDATGTMAYLELMNMNIDKVKTSRSVSYIDHNTLQTGFENADDHAFLQSVADKYGIYFSKAGNGICHQVQLERFTKPLTTLLGSDSHTPTSGALGALAIGAGGLDVALAMAGVPFKMIMPKIVKVYLTGKLRNGVSSKDIILFLLSKLSVKGGVNKVFEYSGPGIKNLSIPERATICNMGAELGATSSIFIIDEETKAFLEKEDRLEDFAYLAPDIDAIYDEEIVVDLSTLTPLASCPNSPDNVCEVSSLKDIAVDQVLIGSCTNSSYLDMVQVASILKGHKIAKNVSLAINPGSRQVLTMMIQNGLLEDILASGARILECTCGPCIGMGQSPKTDGVSLRTYNRNFYGRSGTNSAKVYLVSPITAAISAINGYISEVKSDMDLVKYEIPDRFSIDDSMIIKPTYNDNIVMGPNIMPIPKFKPYEGMFKANVCLKLLDNISTDHIMPAGAKILPYRSNIEKLSDFCFYNVDNNFKENALKHENNIILAKNNYGQGSSREHAAIVPRYLGVRVVMALSFARIHRQNLINFGIIPLVINEELYDMINQNDEIDIELNFDEVIIGFKGIKYSFKHHLSEKELSYIKAGSLLNKVGE